MTLRDAVVRLAPALSARRAPARVAPTRHRGCLERSSFRRGCGGNMFKGLLLWLLGVPAGIIILLLLFGVL